MSDINRREALDFHSRKRPGKIEVVPTKRYRTQRDLALAYSPGVAEPCKSIAKRKSDDLLQFNYFIVELSKILRNKIDCLWSLTVVVF